MYFIVFIWNSFSKEIFFVDLIKYSNIVQRKKTENDNKSV